MLFIPGFLISALTFPGVIVHELSHQIFCYLMGVPVYEVKYFQLKNPNGYVAHESSDKPLTNFVISVSPFLVNTLVGMLMLLPASIELIAFNTLSDIVEGSSAAVLMHYLPMLFLYWVGISILMHAFPSTGDAKVLIKTILKNDDVNILIKILVAPVIGLIYIGAWGSVVWLDFAYAMGIALFLPSIVAWFF